MSEAETLPGSMVYLTYTWLFSCARNAFDRAKESEAGSTYMFMTSNMFCALTIEAHLNHVGSKVVPGWEIFERSLSIEKKLEVIALHTNFTVDFSREPFQLLSSVKRFRDTMAHGRTEEVDGHFADMNLWPKPKWLEQCTLKTADSWFTATRAIVEFVHSAAGLGDKPFMYASMGSAGN